MEEIKKQIESIQKLYFEEDIYSFPYSDLKQLRDHLEKDFEKYVPDQLIGADLNIYWMFIAGLASGGIKTRLLDALERYNTKKRLEKSFYEWFPKYRFLEKYDLSDYQELNYNFILHNKLRIILLDIINLYEERSGAEREMIDMPDIEAIMSFLKTEDGGRPNGVFDAYRPAHLVKDDYLTTGVHHYYDREKVELGEEVLGTITFITPEAYPNCLWIGKRITIQEGSHIVGYAKVTKIFNRLLEYEDKEKS